MTADFTVTDEQIEAAGEALFREAVGAHATWGKSPIHAAYRRMARAALAAAGPSMVADAVAAERERIATAIEAAAAALVYDDVGQARVITSDHAARIARADPGTDT